MGGKQRRRVRIGTEYPASHSSIASNITTTNSTTNPPAQRPRQPVNVGCITCSIDNQYILTTVADGRLEYASPSSNGCVRAPQGRVLPAWAYPGRTEQYPINLNHTYQAQIRPTCPSLPQMNSGNMHNVTVEILSSDDEDN
ncbi:hypothetical protein DVH24_008931 [Malus domestica]|uniref:Uncharacterized protein n=1 Tax=Malus domestica TaxID=3750 RepID=A0A498JNG9_MALDO|nr:hypothetical protein DVH24_008931 [Malus domestica]